MRRTIPLLFLLLATAARSEPILYQGELDCTNTVEYSPGVSYRVNGAFRDGSVAGFLGSDLSTNDLFFTESGLGDIDVWRVTNIVSAGAVHLSADVIYLPLGSTNRILAFPTGIAGVCTLSTNTPGFPQSPSSTGARVSQHMLNGIRNYALTLIQPGSGQDAPLGLFVTQEVARLDGNIGIVSGLVDQALSASSSPTNWWQHPAKAQISWDRHLYSSGIQTGTAAADKSLAHDSEVSWSDDANALVADGSYATIVYTNGNWSTLLYVSTFSALDVPLDAVVTSVEVQVIGWATADAESLLSASVWTNDPEVQATANATANLALLGADITTQSVTLAVSGILPATFNADTFGVALELASPKLDTAWSTQYVDSVQIVLHGYVPAALDDRWRAGPGNNNAFELRVLGTAVASIDTNGAPTFPRDLTAAGVSLADTLARATAGSNQALSAYSYATQALAWAQSGSNLAVLASNLIAALRADFDPASNQLATLQEQFVASSSTWVKADMPRWTLRVGTATPLTNATSQPLLFDTVITSNKTTFTAASGRAKPLEAGRYLMTASARLQIPANAGGLTIWISLAKNGSVFSRSEALSTSGNKTYYPCVTGQADANGSSDYFSVLLEHYTGVLATNVADANVHFVGEYSAP